MPVFDINEHPFADLRPLLSHAHISIQSPDVPDADSLAAAFALYLFFTANNKRTEWFYCGASAFDEPCLLEMANAFSLPIRHDPAPSPCPGLLIRIGGCTDAMLPVKARSYALFACRASSNDLPPISDVRPYLTACSTLIYLLLQSVSFPVSHMLGTALRFGLYAASNGFTEIRFPLDKDMRDGIPFDAPLFNKLAHTNLRMGDLAIAAKALNTLDFSFEDSCVIGNVLPCEAEILRFIADLALHVHGVSIALVFFETAKGIRFSLRSATRAIHAGKLAHRLTGQGNGHGGGTLEKAGGVINVQAYPAPQNGAELVQSLRCQMVTYRDSYEIIDCSSPDIALSNSGKAAILSETFHVYQKLPVLQAFVICSRLFPKRTRITIRMLEGDITIAVTPRTYLLIGTVGEVYPIEKGVFAKLYQETDENVNMRLPYFPSVINADEGTRIPLLPHAKACISKEQRVFARQLARGVKIFTHWDPAAYMEGEPGDWLVRRRNDKMDLYVVKQQVFPRIYKKVLPSQARQRMRAD